VQQSKGASACARPQDPCESDRDDRRPPGVHLQEPCERGVEKPALHSQLLAAHTRGDVRLGGNRRKGDLSACPARGDPVPRCRWRFEPPPRRRRLCPPTRSSRCTWRLATLTKSAGHLEPPAPPSRTRCTAASGARTDRGRRRCSASRAEFGRACPAPRRADARWAGGGSRREAGPVRPGDFFPPPPAGSFYRTSGRRQSPR
jgi:hypothetical protein